MRLSAAVLLALLPLTSAAQSCRAERWLLLESSYERADGRVCAAALPNRGRPYFIVNQQHRANEPWHRRVCYWSATPSPDGSSAATSATTKRRGRGRS